MTVPGRLDLTAVLMLSIVLTANSRLGRVARFLTKANGKPLV